MGALIMFQPTKKTILRQARQEIARMYHLSGGGIDPLPGDASRESFELGLVEEVAWQDWDTFCRALLRKFFPGDTAMGLDGD